MNKIIINKNIDGISVNVDEQSGNIVITIDKCDRRCRIFLDCDKTPLFDSRATAEAIIEQMNSIIDEYGYVTVSDFYDLTGVSSSYSDDYYGWKNIRNAKPVRLHNGKWKIQMPKAIPIK